MHTKPEPAKTPLIKLLFTAAEVSKVLNAPESWLLAKARARCITHRRLGHHIRFAREDIEAVKLTLEDGVKIDFNPEHVEAKPIKKSTPKGTVKTYFIYSSLRNAVKIGRSKDPKRRLSSLRSGAGEELIILTVIDGDREKELQQRFRHLCRIGEWFDFASEIQDFLDGRLTA